MKTILILGAGLSASSMIRYLLNSSTKEGWQIRIVDRELSRVEMLIEGYPNAQALSFNALERAERIIEIAQLAHFTLSAHELSSFMRRPGHRNYRDCKDQVLRKFLMGLQISFRAEDAGIPPSNSPYAKWEG